MSIFPCPPNPQLPVKIKMVWNTIKSSFVGTSYRGPRQKRQRQSFPTYDVELLYDWRSQADFELLWNHYQACGGSFQNFYYYTWPTVRNWKTLFIGVGDATTKIFDIPGKNTSSQAIYCNNVLQSSGITIHVGGGQENSDRVEFTVAPGAGVVITGDFTGFMRIYCEYTDDEMTEEQFRNAMYRTGLKLTGLFS